MIKRVPNGDAGDIHLFKSPHNFFKTPPQIASLASRLVQYNEQVLRDVCGYSGEQIQALKEKGVLVEDRRKSS